MATIKATVTDISQDGSVLLALWVLSTGDDGAPMEKAEFGDRCVQCIGGTWGGSTVAWEGSMDGTVYGTLNNAQGTALSFTADAAPRQCVEVPKFFRPKATAGTGASINCYAVLRRSNTMRT